MGQRILADTNIFIYCLKGDEACQKLINENTIYYSVATEAELLSGNVCKDHTEIERIMNLLVHCKKIIMDNGIAHLAATLRRNKNIPLIDSIIAASALGENLVLATRNIKDFKKIPGLEVISP